MRKSIFTFVLLLSTNIFIFAQQVPNGVFETWTSGKPNSWDASNETVVGTTFTCVTQETANPQSGTKSVKIESVTKTIILIGTVTLPGILTLGQFTLDVANQTGVVEGGIVFPYRPAKLKGYYMSQPGTGDQGMVAVGLSKFIGGVRDTIGYVEKFFPDQVTTWTAFEADVVWNSSDIPDSLNIVASSSDLVNKTYVGGSKLWLDSLYFAYSYLFNENSNVCEGTNVNWHGQVLTQTGVYYDSLLSSEGTDSVYVLDIVFSPLPSVYAVTGGGSYVQGGPGVPVGLTSSDAGLLYTLLLDGTPVITIPGTGTVLDFGNQTGQGTYTVIATEPATGCISDMSGTAVVLMTTGAYSATQSSVVVYPNPANDFISVTSDRTITSIEIADISGRTVWQGKEVKISISRLEKGSYFIKITSDDKTIVTTFIKD